MSLLKHDGSNKCFVEYYALLVSLHQIQECASQNDVSCETGRFYQLSRLILNGALFGVNFI